MSYQTEIEMRANFHQKLDECIFGESQKSREEYVNQARKEIESQDKAEREFLQSLEFVES